MGMIDDSLIKGYELKERIGNGGFGTVYRAEQSIIGRDVAIKVILPIFANEPDFIRNFETEAQMIARLEHMHIVPLYDYWRNPEGAYLVMRLLKGGSLQTALRSGLYSLESSAILLDQIASALLTAHRNKIIHRDIKPSNILLDEDGNAYLADFGIAKALGKDIRNNEDTNIIAGSPDYLSPEQAKAESSTPQSDIYSMGVVLYEMLTGEHPFKEVSTIERLFKHINDPLPIILDLESEVSEGINNVIQKATSKNPKLRYKDILAMANDFREAAGLTVSQATQSLVELLTPREQEVLRSIIEGQSNRVISEIMVIEPSTVKWYIKQIYKKLNVRSRVQAIVKARELNLINDGKVSLTTTTLSEIPEPENPYKGIRAFQAADEQDFFGRNRIVKKLLKKMEKKGDFQRFLTVIGPSGSGKSSLVKAGLEPALWRGEILNSEKWFIVEMNPGSSPIEELEIALTRVAAEHGANIGDLLRRNEKGLLRASQLILPDDESELVLVIDQFEEVFTLVENEEERIFFLNLLHKAVTDSRSRVRIVTTLRADFYDRPLGYAEFGKMMRNRVETVLPLSADELEEAIRDPSKRVGVIFEEGLVSTIVDEMLYQPGMLPLLQYALTELFEVREDRILTTKGYQKIGGAVGALGKKAEEVYLELNDEGQEITRQIFLRLVTPVEGRKDTRRRVEHSELTGIAQDEDLADEIIDIFTAYRLLSLDHDPDTRHPIVEVAHEAILHEWDRLGKWLEENHNDIRLQQQLARAAKDWEKSERDASYLLRSTRLDEFTTWRNMSNMNLTYLENKFLDTSIEVWNKEETEAEEKAARVVKLEKRSRNVLRALVGVFLVAAIVSGWLAIRANNFGKQALESANAEATAAAAAEQSAADEAAQRKIAVTAQAEAEASEEQALTAKHDALIQASIGLASLAERELGGIDRELGVLLALEAVEHYPYTPQAFGALTLAIEEFREFQILDSSESVAELKMIATWSPDGRYVAAASNPSPNSVVIWDVSTGSETLAVNTHKDLCRGDYQLIHDLAWSPEGNRLAVIAQDINSGEACGIVILDTISGESLLTFMEHESAARSLDWSPDGTTILTGHEDSIVRLWDAHTGTLLAILIGHTDVVRDAVFSPDGRSIASASEDETIRLWDVETGAEQRILSGHVGFVRSVDWSPDGKRLVSGGDDGLPHVWDVVNGETLFVLPGHTEDVVIVTWSSDGRRIASQSLDATVKVWDAATGGLIFQITNTAPAPSTKRGFVEFSPDDNWILAGGSRVLGIRLWDVSSSIPKLFGHVFGQEWGGWSPDGTLIATSGTDGSARVWDATTGQQLGEFDQGSYWSDWSPDGTRLVFAEGIEAGGLNVWDVTTGEMLSRLSVEEDEFGSHRYLTMDWSPDGLFIAAADFRPGRPQAIYVWNATTTELVSTLQTDDVCMQGWPSWSPDSTRIVSGCIFVADSINTPARIWDARTGEELMVLESDYGWTYRTEWSPDGTRILATYADGAAVIWDVETGAPILTFTEHQGSVTGEWSPDGTLIASTDYDKQLAKIWDSQTGEVLMSFSVPGAPLTIGWSPDGTHVIVTGDGFNEPIIKRIWVSIEEIIAHAYECCVTRSLTPEEREQFGLDVEE